MGEWRLQESNYPSTFEYHEHRERVSHLDQYNHRPRLLKAVEFIRSATPSSVVDLGCGDGGLLSLIKDIPSWGYDFAPANQAGWEERGVTAYPVDVFNVRGDIRWGELAVATEVIEHLADPHEAVAWIAQHARYLVASSPAFERPGSDPECHIWAWDFDGYAALLESHFNILRHEIVDWSQVILGENKNV